MFAQAQPHQFTSEGQNGLFFSFKHNPMISFHREEMFTASKYLHGDSLWKCVALDPRSFMNTEIAQRPILPFAALSIKTTTHNCLLNKLPVRILRFATKCKRRNLRASPFNEPAVLLQKQVCFHTASLKLICLQFIMTVSRSLPVLNHRTMLFRSIPHQKATKS